MYISRGNWTKRAQKIASDEISADFFVPLKFNMEFWQKCGL